MGEVLHRPGNRGLDISDDEVIGLDPSIRRFLNASDS
jgi:hypothetical protein